MADAEKKLTIGIAVDYDGRGIQQAAEELVNFKAKAADKSKVVRLSDILKKEEYAESLKELHQRTAEDLASMSEGAKRASGPVSDLGEKLQAAGERAKTFKDGVEIANGNLRQLPGLLKAAADGSDKIGAALATAGVVAGAAVAGWKLGSAIRGQMDDMDGAGKALQARAAAIAKGVQDAASTTVEWQGIIDGAARAMAALDALQLRIDLVDAAERRRLKSETAAQVAGVREAASRESAAAGTEQERAVIKARADQRVAELQAGAQMADTQSQLVKAEQDAARMAERKAIADAALAEMVNRATALQDTLNAIVERKIAAGQTRDEAVQSEEFLKARGPAYDAAQKVRDAMSSGVGKESADLSAKIEAQANIIAALQADLRGTRSDVVAQTAAVAVDVRSAIADLKADLDRRAAATQAARGGLAQAQASGGIADQTAAFAQVQRAEGEQRRVQAALDAALANLAESNQQSWQQVVAVLNRMDSANRATSAKVDQIASQVRTARQ